MKGPLRRVARGLAKPALELMLEAAEPLRGFRTASGDYLPNRLRILTGGYEREELQFMCAFLRAGQTALDVGANVGYTTRFLARTIGPQGRVFALEPNPDIFALLQRNLSKFPNVEPCNLALSNAAGEAHLFLAGRNYSVASLGDKYPATHLVHMDKGELEQRAIRLVRGDDFLRERGIAHVDIMKIDVEGWELQALQGLEETVASSAKLTIFCEFNPVAQECAGHDPRALLDWFFQHGFSLRFPRKGHLQALTPEFAGRFTETTRKQSHRTLFATKE